MKLVISKPTKNALTETNPDNLIYSSDYDTLKYYVAGSAAVSIPTEASPQTYETTFVTHNLGYYPFFVCFISFDDAPTLQYYMMPFDFADFPMSSQNYVYVTTTTLIFRSWNYDVFGGDVGGQNIHLHYKIFRNDLGV
ncbi:MAG: hypothetical protein NUV65_05755 [Candidatus Roizmanbacteria bacterium]|nr:hypothetical protein [Candidatus Roizmanbacteria bacterium]